ncbi:MAG: hypothetical protein PHO56_02355 [Patescibacteria group bacterium]|nr:hypothetical protein [Patescibacteria group bacterium]
MIKVVFTHFAPHFEEVMAFLLFLLCGEKKFSREANVNLKYVTNANEVPGLPVGVKFSECIFLGIGKKLTKDLIAAGVPENQIIDEHEGASRDEDSSFRKLLNRLELGEDRKLAAWAKSLGCKDSGKGSDNFSVYRTLTAIYSKEMEEGGCDEGVAWAMELARAAMSRDDYFVKGGRSIIAGRFFERLACVWACYRAGFMNKRESLENFFFKGWENCSASFPQTLKRLDKAGDKTLSEIIRMVENGSQRSLSPLGLPRLLYAFYEKNGLDRTIAAACKALDAEKRKQENFFLAAEEIKTASKIPLNDGRTFALFVCSNNQQINCAARYVFEEEVGVIFQEQSFPKRSIQIFTNGQVGISLENVYLEILNEEARLEAQFRKTSRKKWHFLTGINDTLLNGSGSYPGTPESLITSRWFGENIPRLAEFKNAAQSQAA